MLAASLLGSPWEIAGLDWRPQQPGTAVALVGLMNQAGALLGAVNRVEQSDIVVQATGGPAYGVGNKESWAALGTAALLEGLLLDPVYTAKGMAGALSDLRQRPMPADGRVVFIHTGGVAALFAYEADLRRHVINKMATRSSQLSPALYGREC